MTVFQKIRFILSLNKQFIACVVCSLISIFIIILCATNIIPESKQVIFFFISCAFFGFAVVFNYFATKSERKRRSDNV